MIEEIKKSIKDQFETFGEGQIDKNGKNNIAQSLKDGPLVFALGVNVEEVVKLIVREHIPRMILKHRSYESNDRCCNNCNCVALANILSELRK